MNLIKEILNLCNSVDTYLVAHHLEGVLNVLVDMGSRFQAIITEGMLDRTSFERIARHLRIYPQVYIFATRDNRPLKNIV